MSTIDVLYGPAKVGGDTLSFCTRCKMDLAHVIISMIDGRPARVICKTCKSQHNYRHAGVTRAVTRTERKPSGRTTVRVSEHFDQVMSEKKSAPRKNYAVTELFLKGDVLEHPQFGAGIVEEVKSNGKITVLFREAERVLVHGLKGN